MRWPNETTPSEFNGGERMFLFLPSPQNILDDKYSSKCHFNFPFFLCLCHILLVCRRWSAVVVVSVVDTRSLFFCHCVSFFFSFFFCLLVGPVHVKAMLTFSWWRVEKVPSTANMLAQWYLSPNSCVVVALCTQHSSVLCFMCAW